MDGHAYTDFVSEYGAGLYGHSDPVIRETLEATLRDGWVLGAPNAYEARLAAALCERFPALERVRFCNSGTEANIMAVSTARAVTGRTRILVFREAYHGGVLTFAHGGSELNIPYDYVFADYNDIDGTVAAIRANAGELAAVVVEPMLGGGGCIPATREFLVALRQETEKAGALLVFDEVITSRLAPHGLHGEHGVFPDLVTMGKYLDGGSSSGMFAGGDEVRDHSEHAAEPAFSQGRTFNHNALRRSSELARLTALQTP